MINKSFSFFARKVPEGFLPAGKPARFEKRVFEEDGQAFGETLDLLGFARALSPRK